VAQGVRGDDAVTAAAAPAGPPATGWVARVARHPSAQVLVAVALGVVVGALRPEWGAAMRPVSDTFINLVKMIVTPVIFLTIVIGIAGAGSLRRVGRVGVKALVYFEVVSTASLAIGLIVVNLTRPGAGLDPSRLPHGDVSRFVDGAQQGSAVDILTHVVPSSIVGAFATGDVLQVVFVAIVFGVALAAVGESGRPVLALIQSLERVFFRLVALIMLVAPIGAFGAMAYTVGTFGLDSLRPLLRVMADVYLTMALFVFVVLGLIARLAGFRLLSYLRHIKEEILLVLGTSSSEAALPGIMEKLVAFGCARPVVGLVIPAGYSFNLDGTSIYLAMAVGFLAQVFGVHMTLGQQLGTLLVLMLTSKGAAGVTGSGFIVLASTLSSTHLIPVAGLALLLGIDRFMSEARAIVNLIGNGVATIVVARSEGAFHPVTRAVTRDFPLAEG
jgi:aerobic C4-dicarboxylate transport protein